MMSLGRFLCYGSHIPVIVEKGVLDVGEQVICLKRVSEIKDKRKSKKSLTRFSRDIIRCPLAVGCHRRLDHIYALLSVWHDVG